MKSVWISQRSGRTASARMAHSVWAGYDAISDATAVYSLQPGSSACGTCRGDRVMAVLLPGSGFVSLRHGRSAYGSAASVPVFAGAVETIERSTSPVISAGIFQMIVAHIGYLDQVTMQIIPTCTTLTKTASSNPRSHRSGGREKRARFAGAVRWQKNRAQQ